MKLYKKIFILYFILLFVFTILIISVFMIPTEGKIRNNITESAEQIQKEGLWFQPLGFYLFQIDNMTDCLMMNIDVCADSNHPVKAAMLAEHAQPYKNGDTRAYKNIANTTLDVSVNGCDENTELSSYARYWHGYQVVVRPLLYFFNYSQIRVLNYVVLFILLTITFILLYKILSIKYALTFLATLIISNIMIVPLAIQFSTCFYIALLGMIILLNSPKISCDRHKLIMMFFTIGAITSYMDFLTTPILTLGFPLVVLIALTPQKNKIRTILIQSMAWFGGYASLWISKWILGWALTGENIFESAIGSAQQRIGNTIVFGGVEMPMNEFFSIINTKISTVINPSRIIITIGIITVLIIWFLYKNKERLKTEYWLLIIAAMPLLWFAVMKNHSLQHIFFTWRDWMLTLWCLLLFIFHTNKKLKNNENSYTDTLPQ